MGTDDDGSRSSWSRPCDRHRRPPRRRRRRRRRCSRPRRRRYRCGSAAVRKATRIPPRYARYTRSRSANPAVRRPPVPPFRSSRPHSIGCLVRPPARERERARARARCGPRALPRPIDVSLSLCPPLFSSVIATAGGAARLCQRKLLSLYFSLPSLAFAFPSILLPVYLVSTTTTTTTIASRSVVFRPSLACTADVCYSTRVSPGATLTSTLHGCIYHWRPALPAEP